MMAQKEIRLEARLRNNILYHAIFDNWRSVNAFCEDKGFHPTAVGKLLNLKVSPLRKKTGNYRVICQRLAECFKMLPEDLFPLYIYNLEKQETVKEIAMAELGWRELRQIPFFADPVELIMEKGRAGAIEKALARFDRRTSEMIKMHFGLGGKDERTLGEVGKEFAVSVGRTGQIIEKGIRKMRHPANKKILEEYY